MVNMSPDSNPPPEPGQLIQVRNRPALVKNVVSNEKDETPMNLVNIEYLDGYDHPDEDQILWEVEPTSAHLENAGWPDINRLDPDQNSIYKAYTDSVRWTSLQSIRSIIERDAEQPLISPWASSVQIEDYQLSPLLRALNMPRVSLLLADDVGLGKTIQAGLIATELIYRRRINRILIVCPASLQVQWQEEMRDKFNLDFTILDSDEVRRTQRELGSDINPWGVHNHIITSMDYLRQEVVYEDFEAAAKKRQEETKGAFAPWDLLITDEAHHFAPKQPNDDKLRTQMMQKLKNWFKHRLFLSATPHDGYTSHFLGLLELLDPLRFVQKPSVSETDRQHIDTVMVRRLKCEINEASTIDRFPEREVKGVPVELTEDEKALFEALREYRERAKSILEERGKQEQHWGEFIFEILNKRLLSSPYAFARTWWRHIEGEDVFEKVDLQQTIEEAKEDIEDDVEKEERERLATAEGGSWLLEEAPELRNPAELVTDALCELGWTKEVVAEGPEAGLDIEDSKIDALIQHIQYGYPGRDLEALIGSPSDPKEERLIVFTEYKDTQDHILARLEEQGYTGNIVRSVYGGMSRKKRDDIKQAFNDPDSPLRILVGTDSASEGLNLQRMCRYVSHYEIPWNPMKLEQRNGRVDRHGQGRDVKIFHYNSDDEADQKFLSYVMNKVNEAREDLGSVGNVIDQGVRQFFLGSGFERDEMEDMIDNLQSEDPVEKDLDPIETPTQEEFLEAKERFNKASEEYDMSTEGIRNILGSYLNVHNARLKEGDRGYQIEGATGRLKDFLIQNLADEREAMPQLVFDPEVYLEREDGREIYKPKKGSKLLRLGHSVIETSMSYFRRALWGQEEDIHRWTMVGYEPEFGREAYIKFHYLVTARNQLQEVIDSELGHWWFHVTSSEIERVEEPPNITNEHELDNQAVNEWKDRLRPAFVGYDQRLEPLQKEVCEEIHDELSDKLEEAADEAEEERREEFEKRIEEIEKNLEREREKLREDLEEELREAQQMTLNPQKNIELRQRIEELQQKLSEEELEVWSDNQQRMKERLEREQEHYMENILPKRYSLADEIEFTEVGAKLYVPDGGSD